MASGNFILGTHAKMEDFVNYVEPELKEKGCTVVGKSVFTEYEKRDQHTFTNNYIMVSIVGKEDLEEAVNDSLIEAGDKMQKLKDAGEEEHKNLWPDSIRYRSSTAGKDPEAYFKTVEIFPTADAAGRLFPDRIQAYLTLEREVKIAQIAEKLQKFGEAMSGLTKLR